MSSRQPSVRSSLVGVAHIVWRHGDVDLSFWLSPSDGPVAATAAGTFLRNDGVRVSSAEIGYDASVQWEGDVGFAAMVQGF